MDTFNVELFWHSIRCIFLKVDSVCVIFVWPMFVYYRNYSWNFYCNIEQKCPLYRVRLPLPFPFLSPLSFVRSLRCPHGSFTLPALQPPSPTCCWNVCTNVVCVFVHVVYVCACVYACIVYMSETTADRCVISYLPTYLYASLAPILILLNLFLVDLQIRWTCLGIQHANKWTWPVIPCLLIVSSLKGF